ncbi:MAG: FAD-dependent oxidoreductase [Acidobacteriota bacterium]
MALQRAGVLIIGGGLIGSSIAWRLAQTGARVTVIDAGNLGGEASSAGAGMLAPGSEVVKKSPWLDLGVESLRLYPAFLEELKTETGMGVEFRVCGSLALDAAEPAEELLALYRDAGVRAVPQADGLFFPDEAIVDPVALWRSLRNAGEKLGVRVEHQQILEVETRDHEAVVIAAGAWSGDLKVTQAGRTVALAPSEPVKGHLIGFQMRPGLLGPFLRRNQTYVLQRSDGLVIAGATEEHVGFDTSVQTSACDELHRRAADVVPELAAAAPVRRWIGFRPGPENPDGPVMRRVEGTNVWMAYGHYRNGILLTPVTARRIAQEISS